MTQPEHLSADLIADLLEGSLPASEAMSVNAHLAGCGDCGALRAALLQVTAVLAEEGATTWEMPADIAVSLDAAIHRASLERASNTTQLDARRRTRRQPPWRWLGGAAAAVALVGIGFAGWHAVSPGNDSSSSAGTRPANVHSSNTGQAGAGKAGASASVPNLTQGLPAVIRAVTASQVPDRARELTGHQVVRVPPTTAGCANPIGGGTTTVVSWHGSRAVLDVNPATRTATIFDCATAVHALYTTGY